MKHFKTLAALAAAGTIALSTVGVFAEDTGNTFTIKETVNYNNEKAVTPDLQTTVTPTVSGLTEDEIPEKAAGSNSYNSDFAAYYPGGDNDLTVAFASKATDEDAKTYTYSYTVTANEPGPV